jgi:hypothetical protein
MIAGNRLATWQDEPTRFLSSARTVQIAWQEVSFPVRIIAKLRAAIEARVPVGYEDETGFHYGLHAPGWFFSI